MGRVGICPPGCWWTKGIKNHIIVGHRFSYFLFAHSCSDCFLRHWVCIYIQNCPREGLGFKEIGVDFEHHGCLERQRLSVEISRGRVPLDSGIGTSGLGWWVVWVSWAQWVSWA